MLKGQFVWPARLIESTWLKTPIDTVFGGVTVFKVSEVKTLISCQFNISLRGRLIEIATLTMNGSYAFDGSS